MMETVILGVWCGGTAASLIQRWITSMVLFGVPVPPGAPDRDRYLAVAVSVTWPISLPLILMLLVKRQIQR